MVTIPVRKRPTRRAPRRAALAAVALATAALWLIVPEPAPPPPPAVLAPAGLLTGGAGFAVAVDSLLVTAPTLAVTAMPGDALRLEARYTAEARVSASGGTLVRRGTRAWTWTAPATPGVSRLVVTGDSGAVVVLNALTLVPFDHTSDAIEGYTLGDYEDEPMNGDPAYAEPAGFVRVTPETAGVAIAPGIALGQFVAKQAGGWPRFVAYDARLGLKLSRLSAAARRAGAPRGRLVLVSGYRTPAYNAAIGNETLYSRHLYGDAADVYVDDDGDGRMDDLDGDGAVTRADAEALASLAETITDSPLAARLAPGGLVGGLGIYDATPSHGPFIHVDVRGAPVRW